VAGSNYEVNIQLNVKRINQQLNNLERRIKKLNDIAMGQKGVGKAALKTERDKLALATRTHRKEQQITREKQKQNKVEKDSAKVKKTLIPRHSGTALGPSSPLNITNQGTIIPGPSTIPKKAAGGSGVLSGALISGAFPLLFGQGPLGAAAGFTGGMIGGKLGGQTGGFAGGLIATAALTQITTAVDKVKELGKALSVENLNLDPIIRAVGGVGTSTEKYLKLLEQVEGKQAAYNAAVDKMRSIVGDKGVKDIQEFTKRMQDLTNALSTFFTRLGAGFAGIFNRIDKAIANSGLGKAANETSLRLDRIARAENSTDPLMVALRDKRDALIGSKTGAQATKVKNSPEFLELQNRIAGLQHFLDLQKEITDEENLQKLTTDSILKNIKEENLFLQESITLGTFQAEIEKKVRDLKQQQKAIGKDLSADDEKAFRDQLRLQRELERVNSLYQGIADTVQSGLVDAIEGAINGTKTLGDVARSVFGAIQRQLINFAATSFLRAIPGIGGFFANGGVTKPNKSYIVGERGPELFTPGVTGRVTPNHEMGGGSTNVVVNVDASGSAVEGDEDRGRELGRLISVAVQSELIQQKRPGGLLA
jgi:hypothetical protein